MRLLGIPAVAVMAAALASPAAAQSHQDELIQDLDVVRDKMVGLAQAVPEDAYDWRPGEGVRSVVEVYMHVASANFRFPGMVGVAPPEDVPAAWVSGATDGVDRATAVQALNASFDFVSSVVEGIDDARLEEGMTVFGRPTNVRGFLMLMQTHLHEHLGQSIAYARANGVVPPWSM